MRAMSQRGERAPSPRVGDMVCLVADSRRAIQCTGPLCAIGKRVAVAPGSLFGTPALLCPTLGRYAVLPLDNIGRNQ